MCLRLGAGQRPLPDVAEDSLLAPMAVPSSCLPAMPHSREQTLLSKSPFETGSGYSHHELILFCK